MSRHGYSLSLILTAVLPLLTCTEPHTPSRDPIILTGLAPGEVTGDRSSEAMTRGSADKASEASAGARRQWTNLGEIYRDALVSRGTGSIIFSLTLPANPWLDLAVGTDREGPAGFRIQILRGQSSEAMVALELIVGQPHTWVPASVDLGSMAGERVVLTLDFEASEPGQSGYWGTAVVRSGVRSNAGNSSASRPRGVIFVIADTLRADHVSWSGYSRDTTPFLSALADSGVVFRDCVAQATWTKLSVASMLTGLYPSSHGVLEKRDRLADSIETLGETFRQAGYATLALASNPLVGRATNLEQGFEEFHESLSVLAASAKTSGTLVDRLVPWIEGHRRSPFFVLLHVTDPHAPYEPLEPWDRTFTKAGNNQRLTDLRSRISPFLPSTRSPLAPTRQEIEAAGVDAQQYVKTEVDGYDGSIRGMDNQLQRLVETLHQMGLEQETLLVFISDHGEEFLEHGSHSHGHTVYGELSQIPLLLWGPSFIPSGTIIDATVSSIDVMPTVLELAGLPVPEGVQGKSLVPFFDASGPGNTDAWAPVITEKPMLTGRHQMPGGTFQSLALHTDDWKLIRNRPAPPHLPEYELYARRTDPLDQDNVAASHPAIVSGLTAALERWEAETAAASPGFPDDSPALDTEVEEQLRALGYIDEATGDGPPR